MKLGVFSDPHYCSADRLCANRRPRLSLDKMREAFSVFAAENVSLVLCLGDLTDHCENHGEAVEYLDKICTLAKDSGLPFINIPGNHDYLDFTAEELEGRGFATPPYSMVAEGLRFIVLDANYRSDMRRFDVAGVEWKDSNLPPSQVRFLKDTLDAATEPCVLLVHECLDPDVQVDHIIKNAAQIRKILSDSGKVRLVINGHYHPGADSTLEGIRYLTLPAMCEGESNAFFVLELKNGKLPPDFSAAAERVP